MEIREFYTETVGFRNEQLLDELCAESRCCRFKKDEHIVHQGEIQQNAYFLLDGVMRSYVLTDKGVEITEGFAFQFGEHVVPYSGFNEPSEISVIAETEVVCIQIPVSTVLRLSRQYPEILELHSHMLSESFTRHLRNKNNIFTMDAQERYQWFLSAYPGLIDRIKHRDIASFIGMTPVTLSKIRKKQSLQTVE